MSDVSATPSSAAPPHPRGDSDELRLVHDLKRLGSNMALLDGRKRTDYLKGRIAVHVHLSRLEAANLNEYTLRATEHTFHAMVSRQEAQFYWLSNNDFILIFGSLSTDAVRAALVKVRFLFSADARLAALQEASSDPDCLSQWYSLDRDYDVLLAMVHGMISAHRKSDEDARRRHRNSGPMEKARQGAVLTPSTLAKVETALTGADLSSHVRRQPVCVMVGKAMPDPVFTEVFVSIADLRETMLPHIDLTLNPWLFQRLTQTLDRRVLAMLVRRDDRTLGQGFSINLNVATILSEDFLRLDDSLPPGSHGTIVLELRSEDIYADLNAYFFARDFVRQRGYRVCIDGLTWKTLPYVDPVRLGVDLVKLSWQEDLPERLAEERGSHAMDALRRSGPGKMILARCDDEGAIRFGQSVGITLFQGRYLDKLMKPYLSF